MTSLYKTKQATQWSKEYQKNLKAVKVCFGYALWSPSMFSMPPMPHFASRGAPSSDFVLSLNVVIQT